MPAPLVSHGTMMRDRMSETNTTTQPAAPMREEVARSKFGLPCGPILSVSTGGNAGLVEVTLTAPCREEQRLNLRHGPLHFTAMTDELGTYQATIPAMMEDAVISATFDDGETFSAGVEVSAVTQLERVAVVANAKSGLQIHALEFGAEYGHNGHIWADSPGDPEMASLDGGGYLIRLGDTSIDDATIAEVYTFPGTESGQSGVVRISVEAEVTANNCATDVAGHSIERTPEST